MLTKTEQAMAGTAPKSTSVSRMPSAGWFGQTAASLLWITSVFVYGIESAGDWLQLGAASAWFVANVAALMPADGER